MGRSVATHRDSVANAYIDASHIEDVWEWDMFVDDILYRAKSIFPSMELVVNEWEGDEIRVVAENSLAKIVMSEYCGLVCIGLVSCAEDYLDTGYADDARLANLADGWCHRVVEKFDNEFCEYVKVATASNGEAFFERRV